MGDLARQPHFVTKSVKFAFGSGKSLCEELERNLLAEDQVVSLKYLSHATFADPPKNAVSLRENGPRSKSAIQGSSIEPYAYGRPGSNGYGTAFRGRQYRRTTVRAGVARCGDIEPAA
jgi:hypothetical protein